jgi:hypothetical protein
MHNLLAVLLLAAAPSVELRTLDGRTIVGELENCTATGVRIKTADGVTELTAEEVWEFTPTGDGEPPRSAPESLLVQLTDGSQLIAEKYSVRESKATARIAGERAIDTPTSGVAHVRFAVPEEMDAQWQEVLKSKVAGDLVVIKKDGALDYLEGVLGDTDEDGGFAFTLGGDMLSVKRSRLAGIVYFHKAADPLPKAAAIVSDVFGNQFSASEIKLEAGVLCGATPSGADWAVQLEQLQRVDFSQGRVAYLSDLTPVRDTWTPFVSGGKLPKSVAAFYAAKRDRGLEAQDLLVAGQRYTKGLSLHSRSEVAYRLDGQYRRFQAVVGIDDRAAGLGAVRLVIRGDDRVLWEGEIAGAEEPEMLNLATDDVRVLSILVDFGAGHETADHLNLCDAKLIR